MAEAKLTSALDGFPLYVKLFAYFGAPMVFASYFMMKDAGYIGAGANAHAVMIQQQAAMTTVLQRVCVRLSTTPADRDGCLDG